MKFPYPEQPAKGALAVGQRLQEVLERSIANGIQVPQELSFAYALINDLIVVVHNLEREVAMLKEIHHMDGK